MISGVLAWADKEMNMYILTGRAGRKAIEQEDIEGDARRWARRKQTHEKFKGWASCNDVLTIPQPVCSKFRLPLHSTTKELHHLNTGSYISPHALAAMLITILAS